jgi:hypothetical protein
MSTVRLILTLLCLNFGFALSGVAQTGTVSGELKKWHKVTLTLDGPSATEGGTPNPFMDYRMNVTFSNTVSGLTYKVPGYFAADGNAAETSATGGNKWRAHLSPDDTGLWTYSISFRSGANVAVDASATAGSALAPYDGVSGSFNVTETDKTGRDFRGKGRLNYVGKHHLQFAETGEYFMKCGADAPENLLAYADFDGDFKTDGTEDSRIKTWSAHVADWQAGDPTWQGTKGKGLIGAVNYLVSEGLNAFSFLTMNINGDDKNVFPYTAYGERSRMDCSRLDQWGIVFEHGTRKGMYLHFKTQETENELLLDGGNLGNQRKLYYRELIARFGHNLALNWNLGEEINNASTAQKQSWAQYFHDNDPYRHHSVIHNGANHYELMGSASELTGFSLQTSLADFSEVHSKTLDYLTRSVTAGKPWVVACDEPGDAQHALRPDNDAGTSHTDGRKNALWGNVMAGGAGLEFYFGYDHAHSDLTCQDFRSRDAFWDYCRYMLHFFENNPVPFWDMSNNNALSTAADDFCLYKANDTYVVYLKNGGTTSLNLAGASGTFNVGWYDPRNGGALQAGSVTSVTGGGTVSLGAPPNSATSDWVVLVQVPEGLTVSAGPDQIKYFPQNTNEVVASLNGSVSAGTNAYTSAWSVISGPGTVTFANSNAPATTATINGSPGAYVLQLMASSGGSNATDTVNITVNAYVPDTTPPVVTITAPLNGSLVLLGTPVTVNATITDVVGVQMGELYVDGAFHSADVTAPYSWTVNGLALGAHTLSVRGVDTSTNAATNSVSITVSTTLPVVSTFTNLAVQDAYIQNSGGTITVVDASPLRVENNTPTRVRDGYLRFDLADIPAGATIKSVTLRLNNQRPTSANGTYVVYAGSPQPWVDASPGPNTLANGLITAGAQIGQFVNPAPNSILNIPLTNSFITGNGSYNLVLKKTTVSIQDVELSTSENATAGLRPALIIDMDVTPPDLLPPVVNFISPTNGANYPSELPFIVELDVTDDGVVTEVTLDVDGDVVDLLSAPPWIFTTSPLPIGSHPITVVAEDATGKRATNAITILVTPPVAPTISILTPANGQSFFEGVPVTFTADVTDDVAVTNVTLYADMAPVATFIEPPYSVVLPNLSVGQHSLAVVARDNGGRVSSASVNIFVQFSYLDTSPPNVTLTSPTNNASFLMGTGVSVSATVTDNGLLAQVLLLVDGSPLATNTAPPFDWIVSGLAVGPHALRVVGVDWQNNSAFAELAITVTPDTEPPVVLITAPASGDTFRIGTVVYVSATLSDNAAVQSGELFVDGISQGLDFAAPYTWALNDLRAGLRILAVRGVDASGNAATHSVSVLIDNTPPPAEATLHLTPVGPDSVFLSWGPTDWVLDATTNLAAGGWFEVQGAVSPYLISTIEHPQMLFRTRLVLPDPPPAPGAIAATAVTNISFVARWNSASGATGYRLDVATDNLFTSYVSGYANLDVGNALTRTVANLTASTTYYYRVRAYNTGGTSANSGTITVTTVATPPPVGDPLVLWATTNFPNINAGAVPAYKDNARNALAIDAANESYRGQFAAAVTTFAGTAGTYNLTLTTLTETDGECTYRVLINGLQQGTFTNPRSGVDYQEVNHTISNITVAAGATIRVEFNTHSNGLIPEGGGFAWARGRWRKLVLASNISAPSGAWVETGGMVVMEAEKTSSAYGNWAKVNPGDALYVTGATGTGHIQFNGNSPSGGSANSPLVYQFKINQTGTYRMYLRARKNLEGAASDLCNDAYVKLAGDYTAGAGGGYLSLLQNNTKFFGGNPTSWGWAAQLDDTSVNPDVKYSALYNFTAGEVYTFTMSGRSQRFNVDRIVFRLNGVVDATWQNAPESPRAP